MKKINKFLILLSLIFVLFPISSYSQGGDCQLGNSYWALQERRLPHQTTVNQGDTVFLVVEGTNCQGKLVNFQVFENDAPPWRNPAAQIQPVQGTFNAAAVIVSWRAEWLNDGPVSGNPEY